MNCPKCGKEMEDGYISQGRGIPELMLAWAPSKGLIATNREQVVHVDKWWQCYAYVKAFRCQNCRIIQFEY